MVTGFTKVFLAAMVFASPLAAEDVPLAVEARQGLMRLNQLNAGVLFAMAQGKRDYDADAAQAAAGNIAALASVNQMLLWPEGTDTDALPGKTRALPAIWQSYPEIEKKAEAWLDAAQEVDAAAGNGLDALKAAIPALGASCKGCHDDFRAPGS